jgi:hypothetical protein
VPRRNTLRHARSIRAAKPAFGRSSQHARAAMSRSDWIVIAELIRMNLRPVEESSRNRGGACAYTSAMLELTSRRALPLLNKAVDLTPAVQACCGTCRSCITTNVLALAAAGLTGAALAVSRIIKRIATAS